MNTIIILDKYFHIFEFQDLLYFFIKHRVQWITKALVIYAGRSRELSRYADGFGSGSDIFGIPIPTHHRTRGGRPGCGLGVIGSDVVALCVAFDFYPFSIFKEHIEILGLYTNQHH